jgi:hypothetical protein
MKTNKDDVTMYRRAWLLPMGAGITGLLVGMLIAQTAMRQPAPQPELGGQMSAIGNAQTAAPIDTAGAVEVVSLTDIRLSIRQELATYASSLKLADGNDADKSRITDQSNSGNDHQEAIQPNPAQLAAASRAHSIVDTAIAQRQWTERDADRFRSEFDSLTHEQSAEILQKFAVAINRGQLVPQTDRIPF